MEMISGSGPVAHAGAWALGWLNEDRGANRWEPSERELDQLVSTVSQSDGDNEDAQIARVALRELHAACTQEALS